MREGLLLIGTLLVPAAAVAAEPAVDPARLEFFESKVRPVLVAQCYGCHGPEKQKAGLRLDSREALLAGGDSGPVVEPGQPEESLLIEVVTYHDEPRMPPKGKLAEAEIAALKQWVTAGAVWPETPEAESKPVASASGFEIRPEDRDFWAFRPVTDPKPPAVRDETWVRNDLDRFILAQQEAEGLRPVRPADRRTLLRRVTFDLIGLPPTPEEVEAFVNDDSPDAFAKVVDRLLASPHYGERWGRHWLDVARYGEDQAHTFEARMFPYGHRYRDWVVRAFNEDMPYDRFVVEQIAGDLVEGPGHQDRLAATGYFALGPHYYGNAIADELDDRVDTLSRGFLGLTVACARCHDHKYDPISTRDYYALSGVFASTQYKEVPDAPAEVVAAYDRAQAEIKAANDAIAAFVREQGARWSESATDQTAKYVVAAWMFQNRRKADPELVAEKQAKDLGVEAFLLDRWVKFLFPDQPEDRPYLKAFRTLIAGQDPKVDLSGDAGARAAVEKLGGELQEYIRSSQALRDALKRQEAAVKGVGLEGPPTPALGATEAELLKAVVASDGLFGLPRREAEKYLTAEAKAELKSRRQALDALKKAAPPRYPVVHAIADAAKPANQKVHIRGNPENLGEEAPRAFLSILCSSTPEPFQQGSGRLELARAIASPDNPLTARVLVNRVWEHHFGRGLVATPSNFGRLGERPSHPELLDWLASRFVEGGWSIKALHRMMLLSATYQLSSEVDPANAERDADNMRLWRANRRRLEVEPWRDAILAAAGTLDRTIGGPPADLASPDNRRRTLYASISRHNLDSLLRLFDFPDPNITADKRPVTIVPLQQLFALNSEFIERQSKALAARLTAEPGRPNADRVRSAFLLLYGRPATDREVELAVGYLGDDQPAEPAGEASPPERWVRFAQVLLCANEFAFID